MNEIIKYKATEAVLADLRKKYENTVFDVASTKGMVEARKARAEVREWRVDLEKERQSLKADLLKRGRDIDSEAKRITAELVKLEDPIDLQIQAEENRKEVEKAAKIEAERVRVGTIQGWIADIRNVIVRVTNRSSKEINLALEDLKKYMVEDRFMELKQEAIEAKDTVITLLESLYADTVAKEEEQARIIAERAELARLRAEQETREKEAEKVRKEEENRLKAAREAEENRAREAREVEEHRISAERAKLEADRKAEEKKIADQRKEQERIDLENARQKAEIERRQREQDEQARLLSERRQKLSGARRDSHTQALQDILALAENIADHPDHQKVRVEIALIAEGSLEVPVKKAKKAA